MLSIYRFITFIVCLLVASSSICYSCIALLTISECKDPGSVAGTAFIILGLCVFVLPTMLGYAFGIEPTNREEE